MLVKKEIQIQKTIYATDLPMNAPNTTVCEKKRLIFEFHLVISAHSTLNSQVFVFLNPENVYFFKIFIDGFCLPECEFLNSICK